MLCSFLSFFPLSAVCSCSFTPFHILLVAIKFPSRGLQVPPPSPLTPALMTGVSARVSRSL